MLAKGCGRCLHQRPWALPTPKTVGVAYTKDRGRCLHQRPWALPTPTSFLKKAWPKTLNKKPRGCVVFLMKRRIGSKGEY